MADSYETLIIQIIKYQEAIIGPMAWSQAKEVPGLTVKNNNVTLSGSEKKILELLVNQYKNLFGQASVEACKEAVKEADVTIADKDLPDILK
jgi:hypothetical protein